MGISRNMLFHNIIHLSEPFIGTPFSMKLKFLLLQNLEEIIDKGTTDPRHWVLWLNEHLQFKAEGQTSFDILAKFILVLAKGEKNLVYTKWLDRGGGLTFIKNVSLLSGKVDLQTE